MFAFLFVRAIGQDARPVPLIVRPRQLQVDREAAGGRVEGEEPCQRLPIEVIVPCIIHVISLVLD